MKVLETFEGFVDLIKDDIALVTLKSEHGDVLYGEYSAAKLAAKGIKERRRFKCQTVEVGEFVRIDFEAIPDIGLTPEREQEISDEIDRLLGDD